MNTLHSWKECVRVNSNQWYNSLNWSYLYDADVFFQFRVLIRVQELISIRNPTRDSFILIKLNTLHSWKECVRVNSNQWYNSLNWSYLYDADVFFQFRVLIQFSIRELTLMERVCESHSESINWSYLYDAETRVQELIFIRNQSIDSFILIKLNTLHSWKECVRVNSNQWYNSLNWSYLYDADVFFQFRVLIRVQELISIRNQSRDLFYEHFTLMERLNTLHSWKECVESYQSQFTLHSLCEIQFELVV